MRKFVGELGEAMNSSGEARGSFGEWGGVRVRDQLMEDGGVGSNLEARAKLGYGGSCALARFKRRGEGEWEVELSLRERVEELGLSVLARSEHLDEERRRR